MINFYLIYSPNKYSDRQTDKLLILKINNSITTKLTIVPNWKRDLFNKGNIIKIGAFFQQLSWNKGIYWAKILGKSLKIKIIIIIIKTNKKFENPNLRLTHSGVFESSYEILVVSFSSNSAHSHYFIICIDIYMIWISFCSILCTSM